MFKSPGESSRADGFGRREFRSVCAEGLDLIGDVRGVISDPADQRRASGVLPRQSEEVEARGVGHPAAVNDAVPVVEDRCVDPRVIVAEAGGPDHGADVELASVAETDGAPRSVDRPRMQPHPVALVQGPRIGPDQRVSSLQSATDPRVCRLAHRPGLLEIPEQVATENPLRERRLPRPDRQVNLTGGGELFGDLKTSVAATNDQHRTIGKVPRRPIPGAMELEDVLTELVGDRRHERHLERSGRHHDLIRRIAPAVDLDEVPALGPPDGTDAAAQLHRQREVPGVVGEVGHHVVAPGIGVRIAGEGQTRQAAVASGRKQLAASPSVRAKRPQARPPPRGSRSCDPAEPGNTRSQDRPGRRRRRSPPSHRPLHRLLVPAEFPATRSSLLLCEESRHGTASAGAWESPRTVGGRGSKDSRTPAATVAAAAVDRAERVSALAQLEPSATPVSHSPDPVRPTTTLADRPCPPKVGTLPNT